MNHVAIAVEFRHCEAGVDEIEAVECCSSRQGRIGLGMDRKEHGWVLGVAGSVRIGCKSGEGRLI